MPPFGTKATLRRQVTSANLEDYRLYLVIFIPGYGFVTKPTCAKPLVGFDAHGAFEAAIVSGGVDEFATEIHGFLVPKTIDIPCINGAECVPKELEDQS